MMIVQGWGLMVSFLGRPFCAQGPCGAGTKLRVLHMSGVHHMSSLPGSPAEGLCSGGLGFPGFIMGTEYREICLGPCNALGHSGLHPTELGNFWPSMIMVKGPGGTRVQT